jgi:SAM-dependent methyltransferase
VIVEREPFNPNPESVSSVERCVSQITPDVEAGDWHRHYLEGNKARIAFDLDIVTSSFPTGSHICEFGSIPLMLTAPLVERGYRVTGIDIAPERYSAAINKIGVVVVKCNIETELLPFKTAVFDGVVFNELFEHLRINPIFTMREVFRVMKPGATLFLSSPNLRSIQGLWNFVFRNRAYSCLGGIYEQYEKLEKLGHMGYVREYTSKEVIEFLERIGFVVTKLICRGRYSSNAAQVVARLSPTMRSFLTYVAEKPR